MLSLLLYQSKTCGLKRNYIFFMASIKTSNA
nr:MAG TPA: hypothetical protein [Caudoviricetes sp.]